MSIRWYAIRLRPNAQRPSKQDTRISNVELELTQAGIAHFMPFERKEIIHHRTKKPIDKKYPLIPGYAFIADVQDWLVLSKCDFVAGYLNVRGEPIRLPTAQVEIIRLAELAIWDDYERAKAERRLREAYADNRIPQSRARVLYPAGSPIVVDKTHYLLGGMRGTVTAATGRQTIKAVIDTLNGMVNAEIPLMYVEKVA